MVGYGSSIATVVALVTTVAWVQFLDLERLHPPRKKETPQQNQRLTILEIQVCLVVPQCVSQNN